MVWLRERHQAVQAPAREGRYADLYTRWFGPLPSADAPVIVLIHGLGLSGRYFTPIARRLAARGHTVVVPDLPGNARPRASVRATPDVQELAAMLGRWHTAVGIGQCVLVAHSAGCQVSSAFAARNPQLVARMVLTGPAPDPDVPSAWRQLWRLLADAPREPLPLLFLVIRDYLRTGPLRFLSALRRALSDAEGPFEARLSVISAPTLVIRGSSDTLASAEWTERAAALLERGRAIVVSGAGHAVHFRKPQIVAALIEDFLCEGTGS
ncbi:alpha/beta hydrolase [Streptomyces yunnanensis]|uniref:Alpha/beta hydrolase n=1 Tax=Streptomyces yunnanensis TaxID=156453 RepID=A0ABY8A6I4_9ACTN|nr:alpha/beta hydrolase [Streptomyces yunnanensis]WEB39177.1 alpha/beta hydrolase [Streptomyces yunnanensis]